MRIALLCATARGLAFAKRLRELAPDADLALFSFREESWEPPFLDSIRQFAASSRATFFEGRDLESPALEQYWSASRPDLMLAVSWRYMIPRRIYERPSKGTFVFHDSLLPTYRGFSPTLWAILNGERRTGVTLFKIDESVDAGDIADQEEVPIGLDTTIGELLPRVTQAYLRILERSLRPLLDGTLKLRPQDASAATYTCKWTPDDLRIDWTQPAEKIHNLIRAAGDPYPGAWTLLEGRRVRVWSSSLPKDPRRYVSRLPGRVVEVLPGVGTAVLAGDGPVILGQVQLEDGERGPAEKLLGRLSYRLGS